MSYLARLKTLLAEKRSPEELTELTKGASVSFVSDQGSRLFCDEAAIEERAGLAADHVPAIYLDAWGLMNCQNPFDVSEAEWRLALNDSGRFLDTWGAHAAAMGWMPGDLFDVTAGVLWCLAGERVEAVGEDRVTLSDGRTIVRRTL